MASFKLDMTADERDFVKGVENSSEALETLIDTMDDAEKESLRSSKKIESGLKDVTEAAKDTERAARPIGKGFKDASKESQEGLDDLKENSKSNAKEVAASFDGSAQSIVDGFQGLAAEAFEGFGVAGIAAGVAVAAGIGLATQAFQANEEKAKAAKERINDFGLAIIESGADSAQLSYISDNLQAIITNSDDAIKKFDDIEAFLRKTPGLAVKAGTIAAAYAGNTDAINLTVDALKEQLELLARTESRTAGTTNATLKKRDAIQAEIDALKKVQEETQLAQQIEADYLASGGAEIQAKAAAIESINTAYDDTVNSVLDYVNAETGILDVQAYLDAVAQRKQALLDYQNSLNASGFTTEQKSALEAMGIEAASALLAGYKTATPEQRKAIEQSLTEAAKSGSGVAKGVIDATFKKPTTATIQVEVDGSSAEEKLDQIVRERTARIKVEYVDKNGRVIN